MKLDIKRSNISLCNCILANETFVVSLLFSWRHLLKNSICICTVWINLYFWHVNQSVFAPCESICICTMWPNLYLYTQDKNELLLVQLHIVVYHLWKIHHNPFINEEELRTQDFRMFYVQTYVQTDMCKSICPPTIKIPIQQHDLTGEPFNISHTLLSSSQALITY